MERLSSALVPVLIGVLCFGLALGTLVQLSELGGTLTAIQTAEAAQQASASAPRVALAAPRCSAE
jgi:hypothetical protein